MLRTIGKKLLHLIPVLWLVSLASFLMLDLIPGDPAAVAVGESATQAEYLRVREQLGLDRPVVERYIEWMGGALRGDFGQSIIPPVRDVSELVAIRLPVTIQIAVMALAMSLILAIPFGIFAGYTAGSRADAIGNALSFAALSIPAFLAGLLLVFFLIFQKALVQNFVLVLGLLAAVWIAVRVWRQRAEYGTDAGRRRATMLGMAGAGAVVVFSLLAWQFWPSFPRQGFVRLSDPRGVIENLRSAFLPALSLAITQAAVFSRLLRGDMITTLQEDYILSARAKGMPMGRILVVDALRPSSFSLITVAGVSLGSLMGGTVVVESIFRVPGMGLLMVESINAQNFPIVQAGVLIIATIYVVVNATVDILYGYLDPRTRHVRF